MERFCPSGKFSEKVHLSRWTAFFGWTVLIGNYCSIRKKIGLQYLSVENFWKFLSETEWDGSVQPGWCNQLDNFRIYCSICHEKFSKFQTGIFGGMESAPALFLRLAHFPAKMVTWSIMKSCRFSFHERDGRMQFW